MAYCIAKSIEIQRSKALKEIFLEGRSITQVARRFGETEVLSIAIFIYSSSAIYFPPLY